MPNWKQNRDMKAMLISKGWYGELDQWPPRIPYYRHKDGLNHDGIVCSHRGDIAARASSNMENQERYANKGWFWFPPTDDCGCTWCKQWRQQQQDALDIQPDVIPFGSASRDEEPVPEEYSDKPLDSLFSESLDDHDQVPALVDHLHHYAGRPSGSACTVAGCTMTRQIKFAPRKKVRKPTKQAVTV